MTTDEIEPKTAPATGSDRMLERAEIEHQFFAARAATKKIIADARRDGDEGTVWFMESSLRNMEKAFTKF